MRWVQFVVVWAFFGIAFLWDWKLTFSRPVATAEFSKFANILSAALLQHHLLGFEIAQLEFHQPPLALFIVMLAKAHLTSHSRMSLFRRVWVITPLWLSGSWRSFLFSFCVFLPPLRFFSFVNVHTISLLFRAIFTWNVPLASLIFLMSLRLSYSIVFLHFFALITE